MNAFSEEFPILGFMSPSMDSLISTIRSANREWFGLADALGSLLQRIAFADTKREDGTMSLQERLATALFMRSVQSIQGAVIMAERGMVVEAKILVRSVLENTFVLGGLIYDAEKTIRLLADDAKAAKRGQATALLKTNRPEIDAERLSQLVQEIGRAQHLNPQAASEVAQLTSLYILYKALSNYAAHPSAEALNRHIKRDEVGRQIAFAIGPATDNDINETVRELLICGITAGVAFTQLMKENAWNQEVSTLSDRFTQLQTMHPPVKS